jgi:hypothetical protein
MHSLIKRLQKHIPIMFALLYLLSGDFGGLIRHIRLIS